MVVKKKKPDTIVELAKPLGWKDTFVRAGKTFVAYLLGGLPVSNLIDLNISSLQVILLGAVGAGVTIVINRILLWANS